MFVFMAATSIAELENCAPAVLTAVYSAVAAKVAANLGWSDVRGPSVGIGDVLPEGWTHCRARSDGIMAAVARLEKEVVFVTKQAAPAIHCGHAQQAKSAIGRLRKAPRVKAVTNNRIRRHCRFYGGLIQGDRFQMKRIVLTLAHQLSLQKHYHGVEHRVAVNGRAIVDRDADEILLHENENVYLLQGTMHWLADSELVPLILVEVQPGAYVSEDGIVRFDDNFGSRYAAQPMTQCLLLDCRGTWRSAAGANGPVLSSLATALRIVGLS